MRRCKREREVTSPTLNPPEEETTYSFYYCSLIMAHLCGIQDLDGEAEAAAQHAQPAPHAADEVAQQALAGCGGPHSPLVSLSGGAGRGRGGYFGRPCAYLCACAHMHASVCVCLS